MKKILFLILIIVEILMMGMVYAETVNKELSDNLLRLHIVANSNKREDQNVKYMVRDMVIEYIKNNELDSKKEVICDIKNIEKDIDIYLKEQRIEYSCKVFYTVSDFYKKEYNNVTLPSGKYECIKIILGNGDGENWWCIAFPPLCFTESVSGVLSKESEEKLQRELNCDTYEIIKNNKREYKIRFKIVDIFNKTKDLIM